MGETLELVKALISNTQLTNARLEALAMDVNHIKGDMNAIKEDMIEMKEEMKQMNKKIDDTRDDLHQFRSEVNASIRENKGLTRILNVNLGETIERVIALEKSAK